MNTLIKTIACLGSLTFLSHMPPCFAGAPVETNDICTADIPESGQELKYPPQFPIYLMRAADRSYFTPEVVEARPNDGTTRKSINHRPISLDEATALCGRGVHLKWFESVSSDGARGTLKSNIGYNPFPGSFVISVINGVLIGNLYYNTGGGSWSGTTQWSTFLYSSNGYAGTLEHAAVVLFFDDALANTSLDGNGITIGDLHLISSGCNNASAPSPYNGYPIYNDEYEAFYPGGNIVYPQGCMSTGMVDNTWYSFGIQADIYSSIVYTRNSTGPSYINVASDRSTVGHPLNTNKWSILVATSAGHITSSSNFNLNFQSFLRGYF